MKRGTSLARGGSNQPALARRALAALCARGLPSSALGEQLRARLLCLLDFQAYCLNVCDPQTGVVTSSVGDGLSPEHAHALFALEAEGSDLNCLSDLRRGPIRVASIEQRSGGRPEQSQRMREIFLPLGFADELRAALVADDVCYGYLHLFRRSEQAPFSAADVAELEAAGPVIARALRHAALPVAQRTTTARGEKPRERLGLILLDDEDRVLEQSSAAQAALGTRDVLGVESGLAHVLRDVASRARRGRAAETTFVTDGGEPLAVAAIRLGADTAIVLSEPSPQQVESLCLAAYAFTPREREVSRLVALGHSNQSIAAELEISVYTVKDHLKSVLTKTRCGTRTELAARLRGA